MTGSTVYTLIPAQGGTLIYSISSLMVICLAVSLFMVYIFKMYSIYKTSHDDDLENIISKQSLLAIVSILVTLFEMVLWAIYEPFPDESKMHFSFMTNCFLIFDIWTNGLCIFLSYDVFRNHYYKICGICDSKCIRKCVRNKNLEMTSKCVTVTGKCGDGSVREDTLSVDV